MSKNEKNIFMKDIEVPPTVQEKADAAFLKIRMKGMDIMKENTNKNSKVKKYVKPMIAVASCAILVTAVSLGAKNIEKRNSEPFSIISYAAEREKLAADEENIVFMDMGIGDGGYTGIMFSIQGDNISNVDISINKGELYSATIEKTTEEALNDLLSQGAYDVDNNPNTYTVIETSDLEESTDDMSYKNVTLYHCEKVGTGITENYDSEKYYGFYIPDDDMSKIDDKEDLAAASHSALDVFDGSVLKIIITYSNGSSLSKEYELSTTKLMVDENRVVTQKEWKGEEGGFVYGIIAKEKK